MKLVMAQMVLGLVMCALSCLLLFVARWAVVGVVGLAVLGCGIAQFLMVKKGFSRKLPCGSRGDDGKR